MISNCCHHLSAREWHVLFIRQITSIRSVLRMDEHRDVRTRKPLVPYGVAGVREILPAYNSLRATTYISRLPSFFRSYGRMQERNARRREDRGWINQRVARTSWGVFMRYMRCVYGGGSRKGGPDGVWCRERVAFRRVWVLWGAYGDARLKSMPSFSFSFPCVTPAYLSTGIPSKHCPTLTVEAA